MKFHYPKLTIFCIAIALAYFLFTETVVGDLFSQLGNLSYFGVFIGGLLFSYGFTAPFAAGLFITSDPQNIFLACLVGGFGAMVSDLFIFGFVRFSFKDEFEKLKETALAKEVDFVVNAAFGKRIKHYLAYFFAGFLIASPFPDEAGLILLAGLSKIKPHWLAIMSFFLNAIGIFVLLYL